MPPGHGTVSYVSFFPTLQQYFSTSSTLAASAEGTDSESPNSLSTSWLDVIGSADGPILLYRCVSDRLHAISSIYRARPEEFSIFGSEYTTTPVDVSFFLFPVFLPAQHMTVSVVPGRFCQTSNGYSHSSALLLIISGFHCLF